MLYPRAFPGQGAIRAAGASNVARAAQLLGLARPLKLRGTTKEELEASSWTGSRTERNMGYCQLSAIFPSNRRERRQRWQSVGIRPQSMANRCASISAFPTAPARTRG